MGDKKVKAYIVLQLNQEELDKSIKETICCAFNLEEKGKMESNQIFSALYSVRQCAAKNNLFSSETTTQYEKLISMIAKDMGL